SETSRSASTWPYRLVTRSMLTRTTRRRVSAGDSHAARPPRKGVEQADERLGITELAVGDHLCELRRLEGARLADHLALVERWRPLGKIGGEEQVHQRVVAARHRVPLGH